MSCFPASENDLDQFRAGSGLNLYFCAIVRTLPVHTRLLTGLVLLAFIAQSFSRTWVVADYWLHTGYYAAHCENKARPELHCNGKCQMMKNMRAEERKDAENQERLSEKFDNLPLSSKHFIADLVAPTILLGLTSTPPYSSAGPLNGHGPAMLRPPAA